MKKFLAFGICSLISSLAGAQSMTEESYIVYEEPYVARSYGNANWSYVNHPQTYQRPVYTNAYPQTQTYPYGQAYTSPRQEERSFAYNSPVFKRFYATLRAGMGGTFGWDKDERAGKIENPVSAILSFSLGTRVHQNVRLDAEVAYHTKDKLYHGQDLYLTGEGKYSQFDLGLNAYYDFETGSNLRPFIGVGVWAAISKVHARITNTYLDTRNTSRTKTNFALSGALGLAYQVSDSITLEVMGRGRYIFDEDIYNIEGLVGSRFSF